LPREQLYALLNEANTTFQQANAAVDRPDVAGQLYEKAVLLYEKIIDQGKVRNAGLYYNLANAYLLKEDIGRAILNYRRAAKLDGADVNIQKNLAFARGRRVDTVEVGAEKRVLETLFFWHYDVPLKMKVLLTCLSLAVLCIGLTLIVWFGRGPVVVTVAALSGVVLLCLLASTLVETTRQANARYGVITAGEVVARQGDGPNYPPSFKDPLHAGTEFQLVEQRPGWLHIVLSNGTEAWIPDDTAGLV
jgi:tetratricopeptide (TPR) repeat protein